MLPPTSTKNPKSTLKARKYLYNSYSLNLTDFGNCDGRVLYSFLFPFHLLLESATAEKQNCAFLLILRDNRAEKSLQISVNAKSC